VDAAGHFIFTRLRSGTYNVRAYYKGEWSEWQRNVIVRHGKVTEITLRVAPVRCGETQEVMRVTTGVVKSGAARSGFTALAAAVWVMCLGFAAVPEAGASDLTPETAQCIRPLRTRDGSEDECYSGEPAFSRGGSAAGRAAERSIGGAA
jgi:hypothetical protein